MLPLLCEGRWCCEEKISDCDCIAVDSRNGSFAWQTGTSAWGLMCCYEGILGLNRDYDGLHINPAFPASWKNVSATRNFRGNKLNIKYVNNGGEKVTLVVDGKAIDSNIVPAFDDNKEHNIEVIIG